MKPKDLAWFHDKITRRYQSKQRHLLRAEAKHVKMPMRATNDEIVHLQGALESLRAVIEIIEEHMNGKLTIKNIIHPDGSTGAEFMLELPNHDSTSKDISN